MPRSCCSRSGALLLALLLQASLEVHGWCLESSQCQDLTTESNLLAFPLEFKRELAGERPELALSPEGPDEGAAARADLEYGLVAEAEAAAKKDEGPYRMEHFRWGSPPKDKRYGGFMTSEKSQTPLVTLFKNAIIKNAHKKGQ
ncbi:pro-opiomelanocortin [Pteropus alecto]|uniref:Pro-opiomelanocortin n=1 Tax=Pteropus alecto TaxID=9402 RepID=L5KRG1_PTEAL|nr:pro-opiomelanocortin [Pteropus alecto]ELK14037.1 Pro-opiomelanocortin [Pteropus alecto]